MHDSRLNDAKRLINVLKDLQNTHKPAGQRNRVIVESGPEETLNAILDQIDKTVLPRLLRFEKRYEQELLLEVAERRVIKFKAVDQKNDTPLDTEPDGSAGVLAEALAHFCENCGELRYRAIRPTEPIAEGAFGVSVMQIREYLCGRMDAMRPAKTLDAAIAESKDFALALCVDTFCGPETLIGQQDLANRLRDLNARHPADTSAQRCTIWSGATGLDPSIMRVERDDGRVWLAFEADEIETCISCWAGVFSATG